MNEKRVIPCLNIKNGSVVKGVKFVDLKDAGDPVECAKAYVAQGADELAFLDITATTDGRATVVDMVRKVAEHVTIPFTVGGGIRTIDDIEAILQAGADKVSINSAAVNRPELISDAAEKFGSKRICIAIDVNQRDDGSYAVLINGGQKDSGLDAVEWAKRCETLGAGELLVTSMDCDGQKSGYDNVITRQIADAVSIPVIASGGAGNLEHMYEAVTAGGADAVLAASIFHYGTYTIQELKDYLKSKNIPIRD